MEKLLLVEDDPTLIRMLTDFLTGENFQIISVTGQRAAENVCCGLTSVR